MKILSILAIALYLGIFSKQTTGLNIVQYNCESTISNCYTIGEEKANWDKANATCVEQEGTLIGYSSYEINEIVKANNGGEFWTGYRREGNICEFKSTNGEDSPNSYHNLWKENHPIDGMDCVGFDGESEKFLSLDCNTSNTVVCEIGNDTCKSRVGEYEDICSSAFSSGIPTESSLRNLTLNSNLTTDDIIDFYNYRQDIIVVTKLRANTQTQIPISSSNIIQIGTDTFQENTSLAIHSTSNTSKFENSSLEFGSDIITIYTSNNSTTDLTIAFNSYYFNEDDKCLQLISDGYWSSGVHTNFSISDQTIACTINHQGISTIAVERNYNVIAICCAIIALVIVVIIWLTSLVLLLSSVVIFIVSWKKFFSHDINVLYFNNTLALFLAMLSLSFLIPISGTVFYCSVVSFVLNFLWTNVFLSSLSIVIVVFYTIWIVSIRHTARKLYKYLIPICWGVSILWAAAWVPYNIVIANLCNSRYNEQIGNSRYNEQKFNEPCGFSYGNQSSEIGWSFLGLMISILLINILLLILSLVKIWLVLRKQNNQEGELKRLRRVVIGGILLVPALGLPLSLPFIALIALQLPDVNISFSLKNVLAPLIVILINCPIGIVHFILVTCKIKETILRKYCCCCCRRITPAQIAHSLHLNIARRAPKANRDTPDDVIPLSVPALNLLSTPIIIMNQLTN